MRKQSCLDSKSDGCNLFDIRVGVKFSAIGSLPKCSTADQPRRNSDIPIFRYSDAGSIGSERRWDCSCQESNRSRHSPSSLLVLHLPSLIFVQLRKKYLVAKFRCRMSIFMRGTINRIVPNSCILRETRIPLADDCQIKWVKRRSGQC